MRILCSFALILSGDYLVHLRGHFFLRNECAYFNGLCYL